MQKEYFAHELALLMDPEGKAEAQLVKNLNLKPLFGSLQYYPFEGKMGGSKHHPREVQNPILLGKTLCDEPDG